MARWYDPYLNHFTQSDTIIPDPYNQISWNRYAYVDSNPLKYIDITGHEKVIIVYGTNYTTKTNAFYAAAQTAYQNALNAGHTEDEILMVDVASDQDFYNAIAGNDPGEIEQVLLFRHGYAEAGSTVSYMYMSSATEGLEEYLEFDQAVFDASDLNDSWADLAGLFADNSSITINACLVGAGKFPQILANTLGTTVYAYENNLHFYQLHQTTNIHCGRNPYRISVALQWKWKLCSGNICTNGSGEGWKVSIPIFLQATKRIYVRVEKKNYHEKEKNSINLNNHNNYYQSDDISKK